MTQTQPTPAVAAPALAFPADFVWGAATAAYQIEGAATELGRTPSIWDTFSHTPGMVMNGDTGDTAVDHLHRYREDVALMRRLGLTAYRFSVSWPRVQPNGRGTTNAGGLDFYRRLVDELLANHIEPWLTLYHWDLPQPLEDAGGWPERDTAHRFAEYAELVYDALGDRVQHWTTLNEPWCSAFLGYASGVHAPGRREPLASLAASHHLLLGHGLAVQAMRSRARPGLEAGITLNLYATEAASDDGRDHDAERRVDGLQNRWFLDPLLLGRYPADVLDDVAHLGEISIEATDLATISAPIDFLGVNYYTRHTVAAGTGPGDAGAASDWPGSEHVRFISTGRPVTGMGWEVDGSGLTAILLRIRDDYPPIDIYVTENGAAFEDVLEDGAVHDVLRTRYIDEHLRACHAGLADGVPLRGYFVWSLLDNFEWAYGYARRFGIVYVDYATLERIPKDSAHWYADMIRHGGLEARAPG
ncbi:MAG: GH1 family beta-glucosidase [Candidatus Nanopelagicales bacterium]